MRRLRDDQIHATIDRVMKFRGSSWRAVQLAELRRLAAERERGGAGSVVEGEQLSGAVEQVRKDGACGGRLSSQWN
jgi:hypothetical protein